VPITDGANVLGVARVALPATRVDRYVGSAVTTILVALAVIAVVVIVAAWLLTRVMTRPVRELTVVARRLAAGDFEVPLAVSAPDESGQLARAFSDMAAQLRATVAELTDDRARLTAILDNMADGIITTDEEGRITLANRAAGDLLGFLPDGGTARPVIETVRDYELTEVLQRSLASRRPEEVQFESSATGRFVRAIAIAGERPGGALILLQDLTEVRALQTMRREIVGNISHDFRTPLAGIKAMVDTLQDGAIDDHAAATDFLARIEDEVDRLTHMVAELTELSRIETGRTGLEWSQVDLNALVRESVTRMAPQAERQQITLSADLGGDVPPIVADAERLRQVIINLLHNAVKFNRPGGSVTVTTRAEDDAVTMAVADTGLGIARQDLPRIFERFYMGDRSRTGQGSGMGLAIAKHIVEAHDGAIDVTSTEGEGSTFTIRLPRTRPEPPA
jgi:two-component system phosphate regulon sensor histidine kinase PhoR